MPGLTTHVHFTPDKIGEYTLECNQVCGLSHTIMITKVRVVSQEEFVAWTQQQLVEQSQQTASK